MKKALLGTFVTLLVMAALVSCDDVIGGSGGKYTPDGRMVTVNIVTDMGRSIDTGIAQGAWNYYEVIFREAVGGPYHRGAGLKALGLTITLPAKSYAQANTILLLGTNNGKTLVATGRLTAGTVTPADGVSIPFTVTAVQTSLLATDTSLILTANGDSNGDYYDSKCFQAEINKAVVGTLTFTGFADTGTDIIITGTPSLKFFNINVTNPSGGGLFPTTGISPTSGAVGATGAFGLTFTTLGTAGEYKGLIEIPVVGFATGISSAVEWNLRGGTVRGVAELETKSGNEGFVFVTVDPDAPTSVTIGIGGGW
jgi:hypothetical protein